MQQDRQKTTQVPDLYLLSTPGAEAKAAEDAEKLHQAMVGYGRTDEDTVLDIIIKRSNAQRQTLKKKYKEKYKKVSRSHK